MLDVVATDEQLGKPAGNDLAEGVYTLPVIRALGSNEGSELREILGSPIDRPEVDRARKLVRADDAVDYSLAMARSYTDEAIVALAVLPTSEATDRLAEAADQLARSVAAA